MKNLNREYDTMQAAQMGNGAKHVLTGIVVGGVIGATAMLFLAPRSGEEMRCGSPRQSPGTARPDD